MVNPTRLKTAASKREAPVHWFKWVIEEELHSHIARTRDEAGCGPNLPRAKRATTPVKKVSK
jgi:hypothetical protein